MLLVYGTLLSAPTNKVRYTANYLQIPYEFHPINLAAGEQRSAEYLKINPYGKVPAIVDDGFNLAESNAIIRYFATQKQSPIYPQDLHQRAIVDQWIDYSSQHIMMAFSKIMFNTYFCKLINIPVDVQSIQDSQRFIAHCLPIVEQQLVKQTYIVGKTITLADFALLAALDTSEMCQIDLSHYPHIAAWRKELMAKQFYQNVHENYAASFYKVTGKNQAVA